MGIKDNMDPLDLLQKTERALTDIKQLGLYKLLFSAKVAFCFILLFLATGIVIFSSWAVCRHYIDSSTYGTVIVTFGALCATIAGVYNVVHGLNDRASMQIVANSGGNSPTPTALQNPDLPPNGIP